MLTLALDTSASPGSVALGRPDRILAETPLQVRATSSETVLPAIRDLLDECGAVPGDLRRVVVGAGPGSFTGVRIGASIAKGLCFALDLPLYAYSSLAAAAVDSGITGTVCVLVDARRDQVYGAGYRVRRVRAGEAGLDVLFEPRAGSVAEVWQEARKLGPAVLVGSGSTRHRETLIAAGAEVAAKGAGRPTARALLSLLSWDEAAGRVPDVRSWEPRYVRAPQAEREWTGK